MGFIIVIMYFLPDFTHWVLIRERNPRRGPCVTHEAGSAPALAAVLRPVTPRSPVPLTSALVDALAVAAQQQPRGSPFGIRPLSRAPMRKQWQEIDPESLKSLHPLQTSGHIIITMMKLRVAIVARATCSSNRYSFMAKG